MEVLLAGGRSSGGGGGRRPVRSDPQRSSMDLLDTLVQGFLTGSGPTYDYESAIQDAAHSIRQAYGSEIGAIRANNREARKDTKKARREVEAMYRGLARSMGADAQRSSRAAARSAHEVMGITRAGNQIMRKETQKSTGAEAKLLKGLGLKATAKDVIAPDYDRLGQSINRNTQEGGRAARTEKQMGGADRRYYQRAAAGARFEGVDRSANLMEDLTDFVRGQRQQIGSLRGDRAQELASSKASIQSQAAQMQADTEQQTYDRLMEYMNLRADLENTAFDNNLNAQKFRWGQRTDKWDRKQEQHLAQLNAQFKAQELAQNNAPEGLTDLLPGNFGDAFKIIQNSGKGSQKPMGALMELFNSRAFRTDRVGKGDNRVKLTPYQAMAMARKKAKEMNLNPQQTEALVMAVLSSVG